MLTREFSRREAVAALGAGAVLLSGCATTQLASPGSGKEEAERLLGFRVIRVDEEGT